ncbi:MULTISPECIES: EAL domain-containing protein [Gammaproteobacteria]|uniref:bifunctional diguanylate cyclase/phosphodiesterase n=1 Tax=Gammaproteobacteria TaxID=1236 RepID=UPI000DD02CDB|nr:MULTISPECIES: EAL domain-containing protein [Gammaproteobacteria]RTE86559.1 EAL domain-containing protein [Aliidiomarina sp. B3213]TCZ90886.1 EAL domain-containing protein [Lysobacter sp. N42]
MRAFARLMMLLLVVVAIFTSYIAWQRTLSSEQKQLSHLSGILAQGFEHQMAKQDVIQQILAEGLEVSSESSSTETAQDFFQRMRPYHRSALGYAMLDMQGNVLGSSLPEYEFAPDSQSALDMSSESLQEAILTRSFQIGRPQLSTTIDKWVTPLYTPVFDDDNEVRAIMVSMLIIDSDNAAWSELQLEDNIEIVLVRDDGYLNYMYPEPATRERYDRIYQTRASEPLRNLIREQHGWASYDRPYNMAGGYRHHYLWVEPMAQYGMTAVAMKDRRYVIMAWLSNLALPTVVWLLGVLVLIYGYRRAKRLIDVSDQDLRSLNSQLSSSLEQYDSLTQLLPVGVYQGRVNSEGEREVTYLNQRAREILELPDSLPLERMFTEIEQRIHPSDRYDYNHQSLKAAREKAPLYWQGRILVGSEIRWVEVQSIPQVKDNESLLWNGVIIDTTASKRAEEQINQLAFYDALTKLPNRRMLQEKVKNLKHKMQSIPQYAAVLCFDVDNFKTLNDSLGQQAGDDLLVTLSERLRRSIRDQDFVARIGGDEFVVVLTRLSEHASAAANQTRALAAELIRDFEQPVALNESFYRVTASVGITLFDNDTRSVDTLLQQADQAMYQAKAAGRNTHIFFDESIQTMLQDRQELVRDLHRAIEDNEFELHYQLIVEADKSVHGVEALVRWSHPDRGMIPPNDFIPLAEETGDILLLGEQILTSACQQLNEWHQDPERKHWTMSVNLSVRQLHSPSFVADTLSIIEKSGVEPQYLVLEITESMLLSEPDDAIEKMTALKQHGVKFALDDFGTGYSSLSYLNSLPLDKLKIDQSFVQNLHKNESPRTITRTIISLGESLRLKLVAEGVETKTQMELLAAQGCQLFQGYLINRPTPVSQIDLVLKRLQEGSEA